MSKRSEKEARENADLVALLARFSQHDKLRRRLKAIQCPVTAAGVPEGLIEEVAALV